MLDEKHDGKAMKNHQCVYDEHGFCLDCDKPGPEVQSRFEAWWENEGSDPFDEATGEGGRSYLDPKECHDLCWTAWKNGGFRRADGPSELVSIEEAEKIAIRLAMNFIRDTGCQTEEDVAKASAKLLAVTVDLVEESTKASLGIDQIQMVDGQGNPLIN